jgi:tetratricopeptide (TPR) repeat protein
MRAVRLTLPVALVAAALGGRTGSAAAQADSAHLAVPSASGVPAAPHADAPAADTAHARDALEPQRALERYEAILARDSTDYDANWRAAIALINIGKQTPDSVKSPARDSLYARAELLARRAVAANPDDAEGHFTLAQAIGRASLTKGKKERVRRAAEIRAEALRAIELDPRHDGAYHVLGRWNAEIMRLSGLTRFFAKSFLGAGIFNQASWQGAVTNMEKAVELNPRRIYHHLDLAEVYVDVKRYDDARAQLEQVESLPVADVLDPAYKADAARLLERIAGRTNG